MRGMCTEKIRTLSQSGTKKNAFLSFYISTFCSQTDGQNIYIMDAHRLEESAQIKLDLYLNLKLRNSRFCIFACMPFVARPTDKIFTE